MLALAIAGCVPDEAAKEKGKPAPAPTPVPPAPPPPPPTPVAPPPAANPAASGSTAPAPSAAAPAKDDALLTAPFADFFDRQELGDDWRTTSNVWRITDGKLCGRGARNHGVWLKRRLPTNARIELDATSASADGDIKLEVWGDGRSHATGVSYTNATSYVVIFGGWKNQFHVLARIDEHAKDRPEVRIDPDNQDVRARKVEPNRSYHFKIERIDGKTVRWFVDDIEILTYPDPQPMKGAGHEHMGFNNWEVPVCFDNLKIAPLPGK